MDDARVAAVAKALSHPARLRLLRLIAVQPECPGADVFGELPLAQSTISEHLRVLKDAGVVSSRSEGTSAVYCLSSEALREFARIVAALAEESPSCAGDRKGC